MDKNEIYFISLINSFLNKKASNFDDDIDFDEIFRLASIHNVVGIIANQLMTFDKDTQKKISNLTFFKQQLGLTLINCEEKIELANLLRDIFNELEIPFTFVKGTRIRNLYPVKELRTSSDIDLYYPIQYYDKLKKGLKNKDFKIDSSNQKLILLKSFNQTVEIHSTDDFDNEYFRDLFSIAENKNEYEYELSIEDELLFCLCHIAKHLNNCGAGIRMFMDLDVLIRASNKFNINSVLEKAKKANIETFTKYALYLINRWFNTPINFEFKNISEEIVNIFENTTLKGGCFGFEERDLGNYYVDIAIKKTEKNNIVSKIKAVLILFFPSPKYLQGTYLYSKKHPILIPLAWFHRLFIGIFKHNYNSKKTVANIFKSDSSAEEYRKLKNEFEL